MFTMGSEEENPMWCCVPKKMVLHIMDATFMTLLLVVQGTILNYYLISHYSNTVFPYFWFLADFACLFAFLGTLTIAYQYLTASEDVSVEDRVYRYSPKQVFGSKFPTSKLGVLPLSYVSWLFYTGILLAKVMMIFKSEIPDYLENYNVFGPQLLQVTIATSGIIFLLLVEGHNWAPRDSPRYTYVTSLCAKTGIEILDTVNLLALLLVNETAMCFVHLIFILPTLAVYKLSLSDLISERMSLPLKIVYNLLHLCLIDIPYLAVRMYLWIAYAHNASIFLMKNVFGIVFVLRGIYPDFEELIRRHCSVEESHRAGSNGYLPGTTEDHIEMETLNPNPFTNFHKHKRINKESLKPAVTILKFKSNLTVISWFK
ncbi:hypothetical protein L9F63_001181 [Diploptera punctata]|uniref:Uncharacterized protein n=1 Tax=Diploptera punctata TaxID=6984 RepID=A0AAD8EIX1_DIPPU|nr:hypothetical protein L9F63_001181 [Diploptera punctata]